MQSYINRFLEKEILENLKFFPVVAILGSRQSGKSTLVKKLQKKIANFLYLDLEKLSDLEKLNDPELFFKINKEKTVCLDEIQRRPDLFPFLRSIIDEDRRPGKIILLGSASQDLLKQSSESLAGRISYSELSPFFYTELQNLKNYSIENHWIKGGYPQSFLAPNNDLSILWRNNFIKTFFERDLPELGIKISSQKLQRFFMMCTHSTGQIINNSKLGESLGLSYHAVQNYIDILEQTFLVRKLFPYFENTKKRIIKSPKIYIRDSGIIHSILKINNFNELLGHPIFGASWESFALENILARLKNFDPYFYRTSSGTEIDLILKKGTKKIAVEFKAASAPKVGKGFYNALNDLQINEAWIIAPINESYPIKKNIMISGLHDFLKNL